MARRIATVGGIALRPGVSRNGRLYTKALIASAVDRAQQRLAEGAGINVVDRRPLDQRTHHAADDDSTRIVGRVTALSLEPDGSARFAADIADTAHGRTIAALVAPKGDGPDEVEPFLKGVSIRGAWVGKVRREQHDGQMVETADDLELDGLDYTGRPGVDGAQIDDYTAANDARPAGETAPARSLIFESVQEALVTAIIEEAVVPDDGDVVYGDPGYQKDKKKRYPLDTKKRAKAAWSYVNQADNARLYSSAQLKRIKGRIMKALKGYGVQVAAAERWLIDPAAQVTESLAECWDMEATDGSLYLSLTNGPTTVTVSSRILDPHDLDAVGRAAMAGACDALMTLDPDMDADIDVPGAEPEDTDHGMDGDEPGEDEPGSACSCGCGCAVPHPMAVADGCPCGCGCAMCKATGGSADESSAAAESAAPQTPAPDSAAATQEEEAPVMAESTIPEAETPGTDGDALGALSAKFDTLIGSINGLVTAMAPKPAEAAPAAVAPAVETAAPAPAPVQETQGQMIARMVAEQVAAARVQIVQETVERQGPPTRKGYVRQVSESGPAGGAGANGLPEDWPDKPLHTYTREERAQYLEPLVVNTFLGDRANKS